MTKPFHEQIESVQGETLEALAMFRPELTICGTIVALLLFRIVFGRRLPAPLLALAGSALALGFAICDTVAVCCADETFKPVEIFSGMLVYDGLTTFFRTFLLAFTTMFVLVTWRSGIPDREDGPDFYTLALGAVLGMCLMVSSNHLLMVFLGLEMASVPSFVLSGMLKGRKESSEAALKFAVYGAGAAGIMLYGISLMAGMLGTVRLPEMAGKLATVLSENAGTETQMVLALGGLMIMVGLAFKLAAVPFHFWAPDVFEGASAEIGAFLSVASKAAAIALLIRVAIGFGFDASENNKPMAGVESDRTNNAAIQYVSAPKNQSEGDETAPAAASSMTRKEALDSVRRYIAYLIGFLAAITATFGNLAAYGQTNIKRLLAYSTIAHAGYMMMPIAAAMLLAGENPVAARNAIGAVSFYLAMYLFMNLGAFTIVALLRNEMGSEQIDDYAGLLHRSPGLVICFSIILFSLVGLPPLAGFAAKLVIFGSLVEAKMYGLVAVGVINSVISLFYYLRVIKVMAMRPEPSGRPAVRMPMLSSINGLYVLALSAPVLWFGLFWNPVYAWAKEAAKSLFTS